MACGRHNEGAVVSTRAETPEDAQETLRPHVIDSRVCTTGGGDLEEPFAILVGGSRLAASLFCVKAASLVTNLLHRCGTWLAQPGTSCPWSMNQGISPSQISTLRLVPGSTAGSRALPTSYARFALGRVGSATTIPVPVLLVLRPTASSQ